MCSICLFSSHPLLQPPPKFFTLQHHCPSNGFVCFVHPIFGFWFLVTFDYKATKIRKFYLCLHFARQDGQDGKNRKENHATKVTEIPKTKRRKYGMNETKETKKKRTHLKSFFCLDIRKRYPETEVGGRYARCSSIVGLRSKVL